MQYFLIIIIKMCLANLIIITTTPSSTALYPKTIEKHEIITYNHDQLTNLSKSQLWKNLGGLPPGTIRRIRDLQLNKKRIRIKHRKTSAINHANLRNLRQVNTTNEVRQQEIKKFQFATVNTRSIKPREDIILKALNENQIDLLVSYKNLA